MYPFIYRQRCWYSCMPGISKKGSSLQMLLHLCAHICSIRTIHIKLISKFLFDHLHPIDKDRRALEILIHIYIMLCISVLTLG